MATKTFDLVVIGTGSAASTVASQCRAAGWQVAGTEYVTTSDKFLELNELPPRIVFIGGGYISFDFSHIAARAGSHVTILLRSSRPLPRFDPDLVDQLVQRTRDLGIDVQLQADVKGIVSTSGGLTH